MSKSFELSTQAADGSDAKDREVVSGMMMTPLREVSDRWSAMLTDTRITQLNAMYTIAKELVVVLQDQSRYGSEAMDHLSRRNQFDFANIYELERVGQHITQEEFDEVISLNEKAKTNPNVTAITFTHLVELAKVASPTWRKDTLKRIVAEGLTCAETGNLAKMHLGNNIEDRTQEERGIAPQKSIASVDREAEKVEKLYATIVSENFLERLETVRPTGRGKAISTMSASEMKIDLMIGQLTEIKDYIGRGKEKLASLIAIAANGPVYKKVKASLTDSDLADKTADKPKAKTKKSGGVKFTTNAKRTAAAKIAAKIVTETAAVQVVAPVAAEVVRPEVNVSAITIEDVDTQTETQQIETQQIETQQIDDLVIEGDELSAFADLLKR